jgi:thiamine monophosphate kinase
VDPRLQSLALALGISAVDLVLGAGEDYAVLATTAADQVPDGFRVIGCCSRGEGVWVTENGRERCVEGLGYDHFCVS